MTAAEATTQFLLPDLGEGLTDAELVSWAVAVGDVIELNQPLCEVETAKALVELPSPYAGTVRALLVAEGQTAEVGDPLIEIAVAGAAPGQPPEPASPALLVGSGPLPHRPSRLRRYSPHRPEPQPPHAQPPDAQPPAAQPSAARRPEAKPAARKLARELGVELGAVTGSGPAGVITVDDVRAEATPLGPAPNTGDNRITTRRVHGVRRAMADAMALSARTIPQVTEFLTVDVTASMDLMRALRAEPDYADLNLTPLTLLAYALLDALREHPELNSSWDPDTEQVLERSYVNLGIAVASPRGLIVPNIKDAQSLRLSGLARAIDTLARDARDAASTPADLLGGTITITNIGVFGVDSGTPLINPGEAAILCLGTVAERPWVQDGQLCVRETTTLGLTFDHRLADGEQASLLLSRLGRSLSNPLLLLR